MYYVNKLNFLGRNASHYALMVLYDKHNFGHINRFVNVHKGCSMEVLHPCQLHSDIRMLVKLGICKIT